MRLNRRQITLAQTGKRRVFENVDDMFVLHFFPALSKASTVRPLFINNFSTAWRIRRRARKACTLTFDSDQPVAATTSFTEASSASIIVTTSLSSGDNVSRTRPARSAATKLRSLDS